ncbi:hypothetical protein HPB48_023497 [Haemaphysalis longicornis]|uniref:RanBP2-type domain-containing protein n=1 Tax=Haemaphysalis longicornis TaxID=44386 RepID=A0A9J6H7J5_HAELO|nr:hypothetical protein HPB48_023497 [Haemaphysalis longicornis]
MDSKKSPNRRPKRQAPPSKEEQVWDCSVCTYRNTAEAFKCLMCDVRKGTSTRKFRFRNYLKPTKKVTRRGSFILTVVISSVAEHATCVATSGWRLLCGPVNSIGEAPAERAAGGAAAGAKQRPAGGRQPAAGGCGQPHGGQLGHGGEGGEGRGGRHSHHGSGGRPRLKNVDRSSGQQRAVTVNNVTVIITEFQPKRLSDASCSSTDGAHSDGGGHAEAR